jgi:opacity protein-like surface antigen
MLLPYDNDNIALARFRKEGFMRTRPSAKISAIILIVAFFNVLFIPAAQAEIYYDVAVKGVYEDNVVGLLSDKHGGYAGMSGSAGGPMMSGVMMKPPYIGSSSTSNSDFSVNLFADLGVSKAIAKDTSLFVTGSAEHASYSSFTQFDFTIGGLSAGINKGFGETVTARVAINGLLKRYNDSLRDGTAYGASFILREKLSPAFWLKESYVYERDNADSAAFSYNGNEVSIWAGYLIQPRTTALLGYNYLVRDYDEPSGFKVTAGTVSAGLQYEFTEKWFVDALYDHQASDSNLPGTSTTDNLFSLGIRYSY